MRVRIGVSDSPREIELELEDVEGFIKAAEEAIEASSQILWVTDTENHRVGIPASSIAFIDISPDARRSAGF